VKQTTTNIAAALPEMAARQPDTMAIAWPDGRGGFSQRSFRELDEDSSRLAAALTAYGIGRGMRTVVMVPPSLDLFALTFGLFKAGIVPVMVDPGMGLKSLKACLAEAEPEAFIGIAKAHAARVMLGWGRDTIRLRVTAGPRLFWGGTTLAKLRSESARLSAADMEPVETGPDDVAAILFTSGSTGVPKGAVYTHGNFLAQVERLKDTYGIEPGEIDLPTFPLFALFDPALGMSAVIPEMDPTRPANVDPVKILDAIQKFGVTNTFGSPALLHRVGSYGAAKGVKLPTLRRVISAGAPAQPTILERFATMLPEGTEIHTPYGATEALPVSSIGSRTILAETGPQTALGRGVCVGVPVRRMQVRVIKIDDGPIETWSDDLVVPDGEVGEFAVKGPLVTRSYYGRDEATALAKIMDPTDPDEESGFWHRMGDVGYLDGQGRLWLCGRKAHRVQLEQETLHTIQCEGVFNAHEDVYRTALVGVQQGGSTLPVLCVELHKDRTVDRPKIETELRARAAANELTGRIDTFLFHDDFPVDIRHNAKIFRDKLAAWATTRLP
jgi:acyl-CoA synthetase (AMP-forming)/AMP-acid ligase II